MLHHSAHTWGGMCIVAHDWIHDTLWCATERRHVLCSSQYVFFMSQGEAGGRFQVSGFKFLVLGFRGAGSLVSGFRGLRAWFHVSEFQVSSSHPLCPSESGGEEGL